MIDNKNRYVGDIDPVTKLRHGQGTYQYENKYFQYQGSWLNGCKHGKGILRFKDGGKYEGDFQNGEIEGYGERTWPDGTVYKGEFHIGEKHGEGELVKSNGEKYTGGWNMNVKEGQGKLHKTNKDIIEGAFYNNHPNGMCIIRFVNGDLYQGQLVNGKMEGDGLYKSMKTKIAYEGKFVNEKRHGEGKLFSIGGSYLYEGNFVDNKPEFSANKVLFKVILPPPTEEAKDPVKKPPAPAQKGKAAEEPVEDPNKIVINHEFGGAPINFDISVAFQGEPYEDPNPPEITEEEAKAKAKTLKKGQVEEPPKPRIIVPEPVLMTTESGRNFRIELFKREEVKDEATGEIEIKVKQYPVFQAEPNKKFVDMLTSNGMCSMRELKFDETEDFKAGKYELKVKDVTLSIDKLEETIVELNIINPNEVVIDPKKAPPKKK